MTEDVAGSIRLTLRSGKGRQLVIRRRNSRRATSPKSDSHLYQALAWAPFRRGRQAGRFA